jgi:Fanconi anemia group M protein
VLVTKGTRDEGYYWAAKRKEDGMKRALKGVNVVKAQRTLDRYSETDDVVVFADTREANSGILKRLSELGVVVRVKQLDVADFQLSNRIGVERKKAEDFVQSLIDGRLFTQAKRMAEVFEKPIMVVEGGSLYGLRNITPNAIRGSLASVAVDFGIPILRTDDVEDSAALIAMIAKREQQEKGREIQLRSDRKPAALGDMQQYVVESLPGVGPGLAKRLLKELGSVEKVVTAPEDKLKKVEKIGEKKAKEIRKVVGSDYKD